MIDLEASPYSHDGITLHHGDCTVVTDWASADVLVTDPPYGMDYVSGRTGRSISGDDSTMLRDKVIDMWGDKPALVFGRWNIPRPAKTKIMLTWDKEHWGMGDLSLPWGPSTEEVYVLGGGFVGHRRGSVLRVQRICGETVHPNEKPVELMEQLLKVCPEEWVIADPFAGSGATLRAAKNLRRKAIGVELDESYYQLSLRRLAQEMLF